MLRQTLALLTALMLLLAGAGPGPGRTLAQTVPCEYPEDLAPLTSIAKPFGLAYSQDGSLYISDSRGHRVWRLTPDGLLKPFAGTGQKGSEGDGGPADRATLSLPAGLALAPDGSLYIAESGGHKVRKVAPDGTISTVAGKGNDPSRGYYFGGYSGDNGPATVAELKEPWGLALDASGNLFIADSGNGKVRKVSTEGVITTVAGSSEFGAQNEDGILAIDAKLWGPTGLAISPDGNLYIADPSYNRVFMVDSKGLIWTAVGGGKDGDGARATEARLSGPSGLAFGPEGNLYISDAGALVRMVDRSGVIRTVAGSTTAFYLNDGGSALEAKLDRPWGLAPDGQGNLYIADTDQFRVRMVDRQGRIETVAGNGVFTPSESIIEVSSIRPDGIAVGQDGSIYYIDRRNYTGRIVRQSPDGAYAIAPAGVVNGIALNDPIDLAVDVENRLYVAMSHRIIRIDPVGGRVHIAGNGAPGFAGDGGPAAKAAVDLPQGLVVDDKGGLYFSDARNHRVRRITSDGKIQTVAGSGKEGFGGDGGPATSAVLNWPADLALDREGNLYINDSRNHRIRKVTPDGKISTVAGNGQRVGSADKGLATRVPIEADGLTVDDGGNLWFVNRMHSRLYKVNRDGVLRRVAGRDSWEPATEGAPALAALNHPSDLARDAQGNIYVADFDAARIRRLSPDGQLTAVVGPLTYSKVQTPYLPAPRLEQPQAVVADGKGNVYIADIRTERVYHVAPDGKARVLMQFDGPKKDFGVAVVTTAAGPYGLSLDKQGNLYVLGDHKVYKVTPAGKTTVVAGSGEEWLSGDGGSALDAGMAPMSVAVADDGTIYLADTRNYRVRRVTPDGKVSTYAGIDRSDWEKGVTGDGGPAAEAQTYANHVAVDSKGNVYVAGSTTVRKITPDGTISTVAGDASALAKPGGDGGPATKATFASISGIALDAEGNLYIADTLESRIRRVGTDGIINTVVGGPDGQGSLKRPWGLWVDPLGNLWFAEAEGGRVSKLDSAGKVTVLSMREPVKLHPGVTARAEALAAAVDRALALQTAGEPLSGEDLLDGMAEAVQEVCPGASEPYVTGLVAAALRGGRVKQTPVVLEALTFIHLMRGDEELALAAQRGRLEAEPLSRAAYEQFRRVEAELGQAADYDTFVAGVKLGVRPTLEEGRAMLPVSVLAEAVGAEARLDNMAESAYVTRGDIKLRVTAGSRSATFNGEEIDLGAPAQLAPGSILVPVKAVAEALGLHVTWIEESRTIVITGAELQE